MPLAPGRGSEQAQHADELFVLDHARLRGGRLEVAGRWSGVSSEELRSPVLVVAREGPPVRIGGTPVERRPTAGEGQGWRAAFPWTFGDLEYYWASLEFSSGIVVDLPAAADLHRRFGRPQLPVRRKEATEREAADDSPAAQLHLYGDLVAAREAAEKAQAGEREAAEDARRARADAVRERNRRIAESERLEEALATLRRLAEEALAAERAVTDRVAGELSQAESALEAAVTERDAAVADVQRERDAAGDLRLQLTRLERSTGANAERLEQAERVAQEAQAAIDAAQERAATAERAAAEAERRATQAEARAERLQAEHEALGERLGTIRRLLGEGAPEPSEPGAGPDPGP